MSEQDTKELTTVDGVQKFKQMMREEALEEAQKATKCTQDEDDYLLQTIKRNRALFGSKKGKR